MQPKLILYVLLNPANFYTGAERIKTSTKKKRAPKAQFYMYDLWIMIYSYTIATDGLKDTGLLHISLNRSNDLTKHTEVSRLLFILNLLMRSDFEKIVLSLNS